MIIFDADLGRSRVANRATLNGVFTTGIRAATLKLAMESITEAIRIVNDALCCSENLDYIGEAFSKKVDKRGPKSPI